MNHTAVTPIASHADEARHFADQVEGCSDTLIDLYANDRRDSEQIAEVHQRLRTAQSLARVHALLSIADEIRQLREQLESKPGTVKLDQVLRGRDVQASLDAYHAAGGKS